MTTLEQWILDRLRANLAAVRGRIGAAAEAAGRRPDDVKLVAVTKSVAAPYVGALLDLGVAAIGENRPEDILRKQQDIPRPVPWHMIGHFQRKKIGRTLPLISMVHSVHSMELLGTLDIRQDGPPGAPGLPILLQVNVSGERSKQGFAIEDIAHVIDLARAMKHIDCRGLMTMAPANASPMESREIFGRLRDLRNVCGSDLPELSMGMSGDFEAAIAEGSTMVRIGSALFDGLDSER